MIKRVIILLVVLFVGVLSAFSQENENTGGFKFKVKGLAFGDAYYVQSHHIDSVNDMTEAVMRRAYLTFEAKYNRWFSRLRFEANQDGDYGVYTFEVDFKDLYIGYKFDEHKITVGLQPTKAFDVIEDNWGARYLMRTPMDLQGIPSRDLGISVDGTIYEDWGLSYRFLIGDGLNFGAESDDGRDIQAAINWKINEHFLIDLFTQYEKLPGDTDHSTFQIFGAYNSEKFRAGSQYSHQYRQSDPALQLFSVYGKGALNQNIWIIGRVDRIIKPSPRGDNISYIPFYPGSPATMMLAGVEFSLGKYFVVTPNIIHIRYNEDDPAAKPDNDLTYRLTFYFKFNQ